LITLGVKPAVWLRWLVAGALRGWQGVLDRVTIGAVEGLVPLMDARDVDVSLEVKSVS
jgi:hypothetical protein